jgi:hypothetical protein
MNALSFDWEAAKASDPHSVLAGLFSLLQLVGREIQTREPDDPELLEVVPRMLELLDAREDLSALREPLNTAARCLGLWNYIEKDHCDTRELLLAETLTLPELGGIVLHRQQLAALNILLSGKNLILSAPTSFGKSILIDALLLGGKHNRVAIVLPTIALLDEFRRRLATRFGGRFEILMHHTDRAVSSNVIFLGTQERLINRSDLGDLDLLVVDEFYKLDPARKDSRSLTLNAAVYQLLKRARQFFFLGPNVTSIIVSADAQWRFEFLKTRFATVAVDTLDLRSVKDKEQRLVSEVFKEAYWPALVFVSSPDRANALSSRLVGESKPIGDAGPLAAWIESNYGGPSLLSEAVAAGVGLHHGRLPRALASRFVRFFNEGKLPILLCTSTLIEGVNTAAKSVMIYDKKINREHYDFFTFSNIRGRAGRLGQHHVGKVLLFNAPPDADSVNMTAPLFSELDEAPDELVVHVSEEDMTPGISERVDDAAEELGLTVEELRTHSPLGIDNLRTMRTMVQNGLAEGGRLVWGGLPKFENLEAVTSLICKIEGPSMFGVRTARQLAFYIDKLRKANTLEQFFSWHSANFRGKPKEWDSVFRFLRACDYSLPEYFSAIYAFVKQQHPRANYSFFVSSLARWFRPGVVKELEELGVPAQISERFARSDDSAAELVRRLREAAIKSDWRLSAFEQEWIFDALPFGSASEQLV